MPKLMNMHRAILFYWVVIHCKKCYFKDIADNERGKEADNERKTVQSQLEFKFAVKVQKQLLTVTSGNFTSQRTHLFPAAPKFLCLTPFLSFQAMYPPLTVTWDAWQHSRCKQGCGLQKQTIRNSICEYAFIFTLHRIQVSLPEDTPTSTVCCLQTSFQSCCLYAC